jgi:hypothetical protein
MKIIRPWQYGHILGSTGGISGSPSPVLVPLGHRGSECPLTTHSGGSRDVRRIAAAAARVNLSARCLDAVTRFS